MEWSAVFDAFPVMINPKPPLIYPLESPAQKVSSSNSRPLLTITLLTITVDPLQNSRLTQSERQEKKAKWKTD